MTNVQLADQPSSAASAEREITDCDVRCEVCDHHWHGHDAISQRYCTATQTNALARQCICPHNPVTPKAA